MIEDFCFIKEEELLTWEELQHLDAYKELKKDVQNKNKEEGEES
jgi:hypothetical protein